MSSAAFGPRRDAKRASPLAALEVERLAVEDHRTGSPLRSANAFSSSTSFRIAPGRSRHQPVGREPITFGLSTIQRHSGISARRLTKTMIAPTSSSPAVS